jgi:glutamine amidotransferase PdxT
MNVTRYPYYSLKSSPLLYALTTCVCRNVFGVNSFSTDIEQVQTAKKSFTFR